jgi:aspartate aminotransferase-like enzyme
MFGPNVKTGTHGMYMHHREQRFRNLVLELNSAFQETFQLPDYEFLFVTGSGTLVNEILVRSFRSMWTVAQVEGKFTKALTAMNQLYHPANDTIVPAKKKVYGIAYVRYETSTSHVVMVPHPMHGIIDSLVFADCISSFPYYSINDADIFTTVSCKQIGADPVLGIIGYKRELRLETFFKSIPGSVHDLFSYVAAAGIGETPHTPSIGLYQSLLDRIRGFQVAAFRDWLRARIQKFAFLSDTIIGEGPVLTIPFTYPGITTVADKWKLYRSPVGYQVFLWSGTDFQIEELREDIKRIGQECRKPKK